MARIGRLVALVVGMTLMAGMAPAHAATQTRCRVEPATLDVASSQYMRTGKGHHRVTASAQALTSMQCSDGGATWIEEIGITQTTQSITSTKKGGHCLVRARYDITIERSRGDDLLLGGTGKGDANCSTSPYTVDSFFDVWTEFTEPSRARAGRLEERFTYDRSDELAIVELTILRGIILIPTGS